MNSLKHVDIGYMILFSLHFYTCCKGKKTNVLFQTYFNKTKSCIIDKIYSLSVQQENGGIDGVSTCPQFALRF